MTFPASNVIKQPRREHRSLNIFRESIFSELIPADFARKIDENWRLQISKFSELKVVTSIFRDTYALIVAQYRSRFDCILHFPTFPRTVFHNFDTFAFGDTIAKSLAGNNCLKRKAERTFSSQQWNPVDRLFSDRELTRTSSRLIASWI